MKLLLIRHGETVDNVAQLYAGVTDSALTVHGTIQAQRLATHLAITKPVVTHIFTSPLQRAKKTADAIYTAQRENSGNAATGVVLQLDLLQEKNFGPMEKKAFRTKGKASGGSDGTDTTMMLDVSAEVAESKAELARRSDQFLDHHLIPLLLASDPRNEPTVAIVSHGMLLSSLWKRFLVRFDPQYVTVKGNSIEIKTMSSLEHLGAWSNTGYLDLDVQRLPIYLRNRKKVQQAQANEAGQLDLLMLDDWALVIRDINCRDHLKGLKRTGGGVGSSKFDEGQSTIEAFFKKPKVG